MDILIQAAQFILSLSILIVLHEGGHFFAAKLFNTRVEKFYLFFNPWFSLFKKKIGETEYGIGWLPLGGYVKISGMIDESMDKKQMSEEPKPYEFRAKPAWQRLIIMIGGVTVNAILGVVIFAMVLFTWGESYLPNENVKYGVMAADSAAYDIGIKDGDKIVAVGGQPLERFEQFTYLLIINEANTVTIERDGEQKTLEVPDGTIRKVTKNKAKALLMPRFPVEVAQVQKGSKAAEAGLKEGDKIVAVNGQPTQFFDQFDSIKRAHKGEEISISVVREENGAVDTVALAANVPADGTLGFAPYGFDKYLELDKIKYGFFASFPAGLDKAVNTFVDYVRQIKLIFTSDEIKASESVGGFISIGSIFSTEWDWHRFWVMTAWLSIILAFMNLLPIPALDGGHVMFLLWEIITGRQPSQKVLEYAQVAGMILLFGLLIFANANDVIRLFK